MSSPRTHQLQPPTLRPPLPDMGNTTEEVSEEVRAPFNPLPSLPPLLSPNDENLHIDAIGAAVDNDGNVVIASSDRIAPNFLRKSVPPWDDEGCSLENVLGGTADGNETAFISSPPSKFPTKEPHVVVRMTNHNEESFENGYDSDGELPFFNPVADMGEDPSSYNEKAVEINAPPKDHPNIPQPTHPPSSMLTEEHVEGLNVSELKNELKIRRCKTSGSKAELKTRLTQAIKNYMSGETAEAIELQNSCLNGLPPTAYWKELTKSSTPISEPRNEGSLRPPTDIDTEHPNAKFGFIETFARPSFTGMKEVVRKQPRKKGRTKSKKVLSPRNDIEERLFDKVPRRKGGPNRKFLEKYRLNETSHPADWVNALLPLIPSDNLESIEDVDVKGDKRTKFSVSNWTSYTNMKATIAGEWGHSETEKWTDMTNDDVRQFLGVIILDGLNPSPEMTAKFRSQSQDLIQGNDFIHKNCGSDAARRYEMFRHYFGVQDPIASPPPPTECPNYKVHEFFNWLRYIWKKAWDLGPVVSSDEQTCTMHGKSQYKTRCGKYKRISDGIQTDAITDDGYTWDFYFRNEPVNSKWIKKGLSPMHARLLHMFENFRDSFHVVNMDNLFNSVNFTIEAANCKSKVLTQGVVQKSGRGVPPCVMQEEVTGKAVEEARGTVKAATLMGDGRAAGIIVASVFDQKPFYLITNAATEVTWVEVSKKVWSDELRNNVVVNFLRFCISHEYNHQTNDNDIADQLRLHYQMMRFSRNFKWWWALWLWGFEVTILNAFMMYQRYHEDNNLPLEYNKYDFVSSVGKAWIDPINYWPTRNRLHLPQIVKIKPPPRKLDNRKRCTAVTNKTLCPVTGSLRCRRDLSMIHFPEPVEKKKNSTSCQLHMWASRAVANGEHNTGKPKGARSRLSRCSICRIHLCMDCFDIFHKVDYLAHAVDDILK